jgi:putative ABC transport system substrate-binding protein
MIIIGQIVNGLAMKRREFIKLVGIVAASCPLAARAQQHRIPIVGFVGFANAGDDAVTVNAFRKALVGFGHVEGRTIIVDTRSANGDVARGHAMIDELVALPVDVFLSPGPAAARAIARKTSIPVVAVAIAGGAERSRTVPESFAPRWHGDRVLCVRGRTLR